MPLRVGSALVEVTQMDAVDPSREGLSSPAAVEDETAPDDRKSRLDHAASEPTRSRQPVTFSDERDGPCWTRQRGEPSLQLQFSLDCFLMHAEGIGHARHARTRRNEVTEDAA